MIPNKAEHSIPVIYLVTCKVNGKIYVGSAVNFYNRYMVYKSNHTKESRYIARAMRKYGFDKFEFSILECVMDRSKLVEREQYHMDRLQSSQRGVGYNLAPFAQSTVGIKHTDEARRNMSLAQRGRKQTLDSIQKRVIACRAAGGYVKISKAKSKPVVQIDMISLKVVKEHISGIAAAIAMRSASDYTTISKVCLRIPSARSAFGFYWAFKEDYNPLTYKPLPTIKKMSPYFYTGVKPVYQLDLEGNVIALWESASDAVVFLGRPQSNGGKIAGCCNGKQHSAFGFRWCYVSDSDVINRIKYKRQCEYEARKNQRDLEYATANH